MSRTVPVELGEDHLAAFMRSPPIAISELVWNALDADATDITVTYDRNVFDGIDGVVVKDNGTGMTPADASYGFGHFGDSWKRKAEGTVGGRTLHGKLGRGRYTAYSIGAHALWETVGEEAGVRRRLTISGTDSNLRSVSISEAVKTEDPTGTSVTITGLSEKTTRDLEAEGLWADLTTRFALHLEKYPEVTISFLGNPLKADGLMTHSKQWQIAMEDGAAAAELQVVEWDVAKVKVERKLYLCDANGSALADIPPGFHAPGYQFTAYLQWDGFQEIGHDILLAEMNNGEVGDLITRAKDLLRDYFKVRANERQKETIKEWEDTKVYPYKEPARSAAQTAERQAFDIVALSAASLINEGSTRSRKFTLSLIKSALESGPTALQDVLLNVLDLPAEKVDDLKQLLDRTTLGSVIEASKKIAARIDFLAALDALVFDKETRKHTLERSQLHRILANETWVFGEAWGLTGDDEQLTEVLRKYLSKLGGDVALADTGPVLREDGTHAVPDLVFSRTLSTAENRWQHLVVELKRPSHRLTLEDVDQIRSYAVAVSDDERFAHPNVEWTYILVGNFTTSGVDDQREQTNMPYGCVQSSKRYKIWVHSWSEIIRDAEHRHKFVQETLNYTASHDQGVEYLRQRHNQFLPDVIRDPDGPQPDGTRKQAGKSGAA